MDDHTYYVGEGQVLVHNSCADEAMKVADAIDSGYYQDANGRWHRPNGQLLFPETRYTKSFLEKENAVMKVLESGSKEFIHNWQFDMNKYFEYKYDSFPRLLNSKGW